MKKNEERKTRASAVSPRQHTRRHTDIPGVQKFERRWRLQLAEGEEGEPGKRGLAAAERQAKPDGSRSRASNSCRTRVRAPRLADTRSSNAVAVLCATLVRARASLSLSRSSAVVCSQNHHHHLHHHILPSINHSSRRILRGALRGKYRKRAPTQTDALPPRIPECRCSFFETRCFRNRAVCRFNHTVAPLFPS